MTDAQVIDGKAFAAGLRDRIAAAVPAFKAATGRVPGLAVVLVGDDPASAGYIRMKQQRAASLGFGGRHIQLPGDAAQADLVAAIRDFNTDDEVDAVLIQHPIPGHLDYEAEVAAWVIDKLGAAS